MSLTIKRVLHHQGQTSKYKKFMGISLFRKVTIFTITLYFSMKTPDISSYVQSREYRITRDNWVNIKTSWAFLYVKPFGFPGEGHFKPQTNKGKRGVFLFVPTDRPFRVFPPGGANGSGAFLEIKTNLRVLTEQLSSFCLSCLVFLLSSPFLFLEPKIYRII